MRLLDFDQLKPEKGVPYRRDHLRRLIDAGMFPAAVNVSEKRIAWVEEEVDAWVRAKVAARDERRGS